MIISKKAFDYLLDHMLDIHKRKVNIIMPYSMDYDKYMSMLNFFNSYIRRIGDFLDEAVVEDVACTAPFVTIGSFVYTEGLGLLDKAAYVILLPQDYKDRSENSQSPRFCNCVSPVAKELLFKCGGDTALIEENGIAKRCRINKIEYPID
ncbi:MAG: hypothetical protein WDA65_00960 [Christensenellales bacterium]